MAIDFHHEGHEGQEEGKGKKHSPQNPRKPRRKAEHGKGKAKGEKHITTGESPLF